MKRLLSFSHLVWVLTLSIIASACAPDAPSYLIHQNSPQPANEITLRTDDAATPESLRLTTPDGESTEAKLWRSRTSSLQAGVVFVSGVDGGFIEPVDGIYSRLSTELSQTGVTSIFVQYRKPGELEPSVQDALAAVEHLKRMGIQNIALVGWSFGGAVITQTAVRAPEVTTVIGIAPQSRDTEAVQQFKNQSILLFHSDEDENVPFEASQQILDEVPAGVEKQLVDLKGYNHILDGAQSEIDPLIKDWLSRKLALPSQVRASYFVGAPQQPEETLL